MAFKTAQSTCSCLAQLKTELGLLTEEPLEKECIWNNFAPPVQIVPEGRSQHSSGNAILPPQPQGPCPWKTALSSSLVLAKGLHWHSQGIRLSQPKVVATGDKVKSGGPSRAISEKVGYCLLTATHQSA